MEAASTTGTRAQEPNHRPLEIEDRPSFKRQIRKAKEGARIEKIASSYGDLRLQANGALLGQCLVPHHEDRTPSMYVYPDGQHYHCFGCSAHGDVIDLVQVVEECDLPDALVILQERHGVEIPPRPKSYFDKNARQKTAREMIEAARIEHLRALVFRLVFKPHLAGLPASMVDEWGDSVWSTSLDVARELYLRRMGT